MSRKQWLEDCYIEDQAKYFLPIDIQSPLNHPTLMLEVKEEKTADGGRQRDTALGLKDAKTQEAYGNKTERATVKSTPQQINTNMSKVTSRSKARKGKERETTNLSKFIFGIVKKIIQVDYLTHKLSKEEELAYRQFLKQRGNLNSYEILLKYPIFRRTLLSLVESSLIARRVLLAQKMKLGNKLIVFKFLENIRSICYSSVKRWKIC